MHESGAPELREEWREVLNRHHSAMVDELSARLNRDFQESVSSAIASERKIAARHSELACEDARRVHAESLNQAIRRLRQAEDEEKVFHLLNESGGQYAKQSVVLVFEKNQARSVSIRGTRAVSGGITLTIDTAPAIVSAIETRDPVVAIASPDQISGPVASLFESESGGEHEKAYLFPVVSRHAVVALLIAAGDLQPAPVELLCEAAGLRMETLQTGPATSAAGSTKGPEKPAWNTLSAQDQALHLQAQRVARVSVAEIRIHQHDALSEGVSRSDVYRALQEPIDTARRHFLQTFLSKSPTMVDYLHLEILRSLVNDNDRLLGDGYPGPMV